MPLAGVRKHGTGSGRILKVLSYNILEGGKRGLQEIAGIIRDQNPDVVAIQEANSRVRTMLLARELGMQLVFGRANTRSHVAWLSRLPVQRHTNHRLPLLSKTLLEIEVRWDGAPLRLFATHLAGGSDKVHPAEEMPAVLDVLRSLTSQPHLLVGDLNSIRPGDPTGTPPFDLERMQAAVDADPREAIRLMLDAGYVDCYRAAHPDCPGYTYPTDAPWLRLDYIFASPDLAAGLDACDVVRCDATTRASDHFPIWAEFRRG